LKADLASNEKVKNLRTDVTLKKEAEAVSAAMKVKITAAEKEVVDITAAVAKGKEDEIRATADEAAAKKQLEEM